MALKTMLVKWILLFALSIGITACGEDSSTIISNHANLVKDNCWSSFVNKYLNKENRDSNLIIKKLENIENVNSCEHQYALLFSIGYYSHPPMPDVFKYLLDIGVDLNTSVSSSGGELPISLAKPEQVSLLVEKGALVNISVQKKNQGDFSYSIPVYRASSDRDSDKVKALTKQGAKVNVVAFDGGNTPLMEAVERGHYDVVKTLIDLGASLNYSNAKGDTALSIAIENNFVKIATLLKQKGAKGNVNLGTVEEQLMAAIKIKDIESVRNLISSDAKLNFSDLEGITPLIAAILDRNDEMVRILIKSGSDVNYSGGFSDGMSPLWCALFFRNDLEIVRMLKKRGAIFNESENRKRFRDAFNDTKDEEILTYINNNFLAKLLLYGVGSKVCTETLNLSYKEGAGYCGIVKSVSDDGKTAEVNVTDVALWHGSGYVQINEQECTGHQNISANFPSLNKNTVLVPSWCLSLK